MTAPFAGDRVRSARRLNGLTQAQLADATGFSQSYVSDVERAVEIASDAFIDSVATATHSPRSFFDAAPVHLPEGSLKHRKRSSATQVKRVLVLYEEVYRVAERLILDSGYRLPDLPMPTSRDLTAVDIESIAVDAREALNLSPDAPIPHVTRALERGGVAVAPLAIPDARNESADDVAAGHQGLSSWTGLGRPQVIGVFAGLPGDRLRFTLAHELGHLILHGRRHDLDDRDAEIEAHRFAGAFLMPAHAADEAFVGPLTLRHFGRLKAAWGIAIQALVIRAADRDLLTPERKQSLFRQISVRGWRLNEPVPVEVESPVLLRQLVEARFGDISAQKVADRVGLPPLVLRTMIPPLAEGPGPMGETDAVVRALR